MSEATARIKINKLLENAGWRFFAEGDKPSNIRLESNVTIKKSKLDDLGEDFENTSTGYVDFLLLDEKGFPFVVLEAKSEDKDPLVGKEQARTYAKSFKCRFVILSNGNLHYFWDLQRGNPYQITSFPTQDSVGHYRKFEPDPRRLVDKTVGADFIVLSQRPNYQSEAAYQNENERSGYIRHHKLRFLRTYQLKAVHALQKAVSEGGDRFLFEMATGTGKTLTAAAIIKLFLHTLNARRVLFLVDRLELEEQARKVFSDLLSSDFQTVVYKERRDDWRHAEIVVTTVQSLLFNNKYQERFSPTDFDLVISDEAHRSIGGNARAVFEYFVGYKLGLTATPRDYLKGVDTRASNVRDPRETERRMLMDTYRTFGCESGNPTFRYSLLDGVKDRVLINPTVVDARTEVTTQLLSDDGYVATFTDDEGEDHEEVYKQRDFERKFYSKSTNYLFCKTFLENALRDPVSGEIGKSIIFTVSQSHAAHLTQILNEIADKMYPGRYQSDFAVQVTSHVQNAQQFTIQFTNNNLHGFGNVISTYRTSKARVCVTVGMMTTGYDCPDILNLGLFRPIFSPTDFIQIKGRGTRKHNFLDLLFDDECEGMVIKPDKTAFKLFDFFGNCEYFEEEYNYDEVLKLPARRKEPGDGKIGPVALDDTYEHLGRDILAGIKVEEIGVEGMKIDRMFFDQFVDVVKEDEIVADAIENGDWERATDHVRREVLNKPVEYYTLDKLRKAVAADRRITLREILEKAYDIIPRFKTRNELLDEEFAKFLAELTPDQSSSVPALKTYFKAYVNDDRVRGIIDRKQFAELATNPVFSMGDYEIVPDKYRTLIPEYVKDYVSLNQFAS